MNPTSDISSTSLVLAVDETPETVVRQRIFNRNITGSKNPLRDTVIDLARGSKLFQRFTGLIAVLYSIAATALDEFLVGKEWIAEHLNVSNSNCGNRDK
jgi:two-component system, NarL family, response regulator